MGQAIIVQAADVAYRQPRLDAGFEVGRKEVPRFGRMPVSPQGDMERALDICHGTRHVEQQAIPMGSRHAQTVGLRKFHDRLVVFLVGPNRSVNCSGVRYCR